MMKQERVRRLLVRAERARKHLMQPHSLDRLEESGYLVREKDPGCRRSYLICLTGEGAAEAHKVRRVLEMVDDVIWKGLGQDEMEAFCGTMEKICENLEQCDFKWDDET